MDSEINLIKPFRRGREHLRKHQAEELMAGELLHVQNALARNTSDEYRWEQHCRELHQLPAIA